MALNKEHYRAIEAVVGPENISDEPAQLDAWAWRSGQAASSMEHKPRWEAVVMPATVEEVAAIVRLCNKFNIQFKASSTGWGVYCDPGGPGCIKLDLGRMNRIIEINEESMYGVVEPGVITGQFQAELHKRGLNCNVNGAGSVTSALPLAAHEGIGHMSGNTSYGDKNLLAVEWVSPEGQIVRLGSLGANGEYFCGDGPGPSLRGIMRGNVTALGGFGVFTKAAMKLYHWPGPASVELKGYSPNYAPAKPFERFLLRQIAFPDEQSREKAVYAIGKSEIGFGLMGFNANMVAANVATSNEEEVVLAEKYLAETQGPGFCLVIAGNSDRDFEYKMAVLDQIMAECNGRSLSYIESGDEQNSFIWRFCRVTSSIRETMRATGVFGGEIFGTDSYHVQLNYIMHAYKDKQDLIDGGFVYPDSIIPFTTMIENAQLGHSEVLLRFTPDVPEVGEATFDFVLRGNKNAVEGHYGVPHHVFNDFQHDYYGPHTSNYHLWLRALRKEFDPDGLSEGSNHITVKS